MHVAEALWKFIVSSSWAGTNATLNSASTHIFMNFAFWGELVKTHVQVAQCVVCTTDPQHRKACSALQSDAGALGSLHIGTTTRLNEQRVNNFSARSPRTTYERWPLKHTIYQAEIVCWDSWKRTSKARRKNRAVRESSLLEYEHDVEAQGCLTNSQSTECPLRRWHF